MNTTVISEKKHFFLSVVAAITLCLPGTASAQDEVEEPIHTPVTQEDVTAGRIFTPQYFERFAPRNALDMLNQVPGFAVRGDNQGRAGARSWPGEHECSGQRAATVKQVARRLRSTPTGNGRQCRTDRNYRRCNS